jgi:peptidoglycan/LPS O-acetylase OafA/YrhL
MWVWHGDKGVDLFFVLSGFLIARLLLLERQRHGTVDIRRFLGRRVLRIVPLYLVVIALLAAIGLENRHHAWANLLFINNLVGTDGMFIPWSWSVTVEMQFYLLFPLLLALLAPLGRRAVGVLAVLFAGACLVRLAVLQVYPEIWTSSLLDMVWARGEAQGHFWQSLYVPFHTRTGPFLAGIGVAFLITFADHDLRDFGRRRPGLASVIAGGALVGMVAILVSPLPVGMSRGGDVWVPWHNLVFLTLGRNAFALAAATVLLAALLEWGPVGRGAARVLSWRLWFPVSQTSYSIYFFHLPAIALIFWSVVGRDATRVTMAQVWLVAAMAFTVSFAIGIVTFVCIEKPCLDLKRYAVRPSHAGAVIAKTAPQG